MNNEKNHKSSSDTIVKRSTKDTVFTDLFSDPAYLLQLYQFLHPEDTAVTVDMITNITLKGIRTNTTVHYRSVRMMIF